MAHARQALSLLPEENLNPRPFATIVLADAHLAAGDGEAAISAYADAGSLGRAAGHDYVALSAMASEAHLHLASGGLRAADDVLRRALAYAADRGSGLLPAVGSVRITAGELLYERDDLDAAARHLAEGVELAGRTGDVEVLMRGHIALSRVRLAEGDTEGAGAAAREAERVARSSRSDKAMADAAVWRARLYMAGGDLASASADQELAARRGKLWPHTMTLERLGRARLLLARGEPEEALRLLVERYEAAKTVGAKVPLRTLQALALRRLGERERAAATLAEVLALAEPEGYVRTFLDEGAPMAELLSEMLDPRRGGRPDATGRVPAHYPRKLLAALEREAADGPAAKLPEPLSGRELEVLGLLAAGRSNRRIASDLFISVGTVKTHVNNLYRKLEAHSRTQAVARARELELL